MTNEEKRLTILNDKIKAYKKFNKQYYKQAKRAFVKKAKEFQLWDGEFIRDIFYDMLEMYHQYFSRPELLYMDTEAELNQYDKITSSLAEISRLIKAVKAMQIETAEDVEKQQEYEKQIATLFAENYMLWWD